MSKGNEEQLRVIPGGRAMRLERDAFMYGYVRTALATSTDSYGEPLDKICGIDCFAPVTWRLMEEDAAEFQRRYGDLIAGREAEAGHDFWLTRNGHGAGFWDGDWPEHGDELTRGAHAFGELDLYLGDDGKIYAAGHERPTYLQRVKEAGSYTVYWWDDRPGRRGSPEKERSFRTEQQARNFIDEMMADEKWAWLGGQIVLSRDGEEIQSFRVSPYEPLLRFRAGKVRNATEAPRGQSLVCMGRRVSFEGDFGEVAAPARAGMLHDASGHHWPRCSLLVASFEQGREEVDGGGDYFGREARVYEGSVELPPRELGAWEEVGSVKRVFYERAGTKHPGFFRHTFHAPKGLIKVVFALKPKAAKGEVVLWKLRGARVYRLELPDGCIVDDRGVVLP